MNSSELIIRVAFAGGISLIAGLILTPLVIVAARRLGFVATPRSDRWSKNPTALMGGIAIFGAVTISVWAVSGDVRIVWGAVAAGFVIFTVGLLDDILHLRPQYKLLAQMVAASMVVASGIHFSLLGSPYVSWPVTLLFIVGITNALNLLDNMDGLAAGVALVCSLVLAAGGYLSGDITVAVMAGSLAGACLAFLVFNFHPARIFMGDCGSMFLGIMLAVLAIKASISTGTSAVSVILLPSLALAIPIFDTCFVTIMRKAHGRSISQGGCDHTSHRLVKLGLSEPQAVLLLCGSSLVVGLMGIAAMRFQAPYLLLAGALAAAALLVMGRFLAMVEVYSESETEQVRDNGKKDVILSAARLYKKHTATALVDMLLAFSAFLIAAIIWSRGDITGESGAVLLLVTPWMLAATAVGLGASGVYRGAWHHLRLEDVARLALGCLLGGAVGGIAAIILGTGPAAATGVLAAYVGIVLAFLVGVRVFYRALNHALSSASKVGIPGRWLMVAPPDASPEMIASFISKSGRDTPPFGIVTSVRTAQSRLGEFPLLGALENLESLLRDIEPSAVLVTAPEMRNKVEAVCLQKGVLCVVADGQGGNA